MYDLVESYFGIYGCDVLRESYESLGEKRYVPIRRYESVNDQIIDYLISEGYADDEEHAERIIEELGDDILEAWQPADLNRIARQETRLRNAGNPNYRILKAVRRHLSSNTRPPSDSTGANTMRQLARKRRSINADLSNILRHGTTEGGLDRRVAETNLKRKLINTIGRIQGQ